LLEALEAEAPCGEIRSLTASVRGADTGQTAALIKDHIREHVVDPDSDSAPQSAEDAAELIEIVRMYLK
jgi:DNA-binding FrmR family transcriptional regulator